MIKNSVAFQLLDSISDPRGRFLILKCTMNSAPYTLISIYAPNVQQLSFLRSTI